MCEVMERPGAEVSYAVLGRACSHQVQYDGHNRNVCVCEQCWDFHMLQKSMQCQTSHMLHKYLYEKDNHVRIEECGQFRAYEGMMHKGNHVHIERYAKCEGNDLY